MTVVQATATWSNSVACEVIEGTNITALAGFAEDNIAASADFTTVNPASGGTAYWKAIFPSYTPTGSTISIRMSAPTSSNPGNWICDGLHVEVIGTSAVTIYDDADAAHFTGVLPDEVSAANTLNQYYNGSHFELAFRLRAPARRSRSTRPPSTSAVR